LQEGGFKIGIFYISGSIVRTFEVTETGPLNKDLITTLIAVQRANNSFPPLHTA
jgi:hypothetical protein